MSSDLVDYTSKRSLNRDEIPPSTTSVPVDIL